MIENCLICGHSEFSFSKVLWDELVKCWHLSDEEIAYIDRQQGLVCTHCRNNLRSIALAGAILDSYSFSGRFDQFVESSQASRLRVLEINEAGTLNPWLSRMPNHTIIRYPDYDMTNLAIDTDAYDLVVHSDTLEHVSDPLAGLTECLRVLGKEGRCIFTVPIVVNRLSRSRKGLQNSYHGAQESSGNDYIVYTEFGADVWQLVLKAGFNSCTLHSVEYPAGLALEARVGKRNDNA